MDKEEAREIARQRRERFLGRVDREVALELGEKDPYDKYVNTGKYSSSDYGERTPRVFRCHLGSREQMPDDLDY